MNYIKQGFVGGVKVGVYFIATLAILDLVILMFAILQIATGVDTPHIPFWDRQISFIARTLAH